MTKTFFIILSFIFISNFTLAATLKENLFLQTKTGQVTFSYDAARKIMFNEIYLEKDATGYYVEDVYCQKKLYPFNGQHPNGRLPNHENINTEHTWPQSKFSDNFPKGTQKTDLHHLFPASSRINSERGNLPFADVNPGKDLSCDQAELGSPVSGEEGKYFQPPVEHRGNVARAMFYFSIRYQIPIDPVQERYLRQWHKEDPVDQDERAHHEIIFTHQGNKNPFIENPELVDQIADF